MASISTNRAHLFTRKQALTYSEPQIVIPKHIQAISSGAFSNRTKIRSVQLPEGLHSICSNAFQGCCFLETVTMPHSVSTIEKAAFAGCARLKVVYCSNPVSYTHLDVYKRQALQIES